MITFVKRVLDAYIRSVGNHPLPMVWTI